jgi:hypothetical protein
MMRNACASTGLRVPPVARLCYDAGRHSSMRWPVNGLQRGTCAAPKRKE